MKIRRTWILATALIACIGVGAAIGTHWNAEAATSATPGSIDDPVVTKSYVDQAIAQGGGKGGAAPVASASLEIVTVPAGKIVVATAEGTEFIVRAGKAIAFSADKDGVSDLTDGVDIVDGKFVTNNHLIISPRVGRGVAPDPKVASNQLVVLVRGAHEVK